MKETMKTSATVAAKSLPSPSIFLLLLAVVATAFLIPFLFLHSSPTASPSSSSSSSSSPPFLFLHPTPRLKVYVAELPRYLNYGLLRHYWSLPTPDSRVKTDPDSFQRRAADRNESNPLFLRYPESPLIRQYSAEYWLLGDLETKEEERAKGSVAIRVDKWEDADVVFVPFFATLSAELELGWGRKGGFRRKEGNGDYRRQREAVDRVKRSAAWRRSGGRDHVFVLTDPVAMWHVRSEIAPAILLVVDFGGWYKQDSISAESNSSQMILHTQVSLIKDIIIPYTHLLPRLDLAEDEDRHALLYFKGAKHRHRGGQIREKLWDLLVKEPNVIIEEGFPDAVGREQSIRGMRSSEFCLHPAGDTPTSCRLFDAISSLCIPVIVSNSIELPFEGMIDYTEFSIFVSVSNALQPNWLVNYLRSISKEQKRKYRANLALVQPMFEYDNGSPIGKGPIPFDGAVNHIWMKVLQKLPMIREGIIREKRKPQGVSVPLRCHCI